MELDWDCFGLDLADGDTYIERSSYEVKSSDDLLNPPTDTAFGHIRLELPCLRIDCITDLKRILSSCVGLGNKIIFSAPFNFRVKTQTYEQKITNENILDFLELLDYTYIEGPRGKLSHSTFCKPVVMVFQVLPVPPKNILDCNNGNLREKFGQIIRINNRLREHIDMDAPQSIIDDLWELLQYHVTTYIDNRTIGIPPARSCSGERLDTVSQMIKKGG